MERIEQGSVAGAHVEHATGRGQAIDAARKTRAGSTEHRVAEAREAAGLGSIARVRSSQLLD